MRLYSPQALAFLGDAVYELLVRERIVLKANRPVSELHLQAVEQVRASYQSQAYAVIEPLLTEEEAAALKRGRNLNSVKPPKNGNVRDYRRATGLESLFGYLYVQGKLERINELFQQEYVEAKEPYKLLKHAFTETIDAQGHSHVAFQGTLQHTDTIFDVSGEGNGPIDAFFNAIKDEKMSHFTFLDYKSHAITNGSDSQGVAYILLQDQRDGKKYWGVGLSHNINLAPLRAILSAINRSKRK